MYLTIFAYGSSEAHAGGPVDGKHTRTNCFGEDPIPLTWNPSTRFWEYNLETGAFFRASLPPDAVLNCTVPGMSTSLCALKLEYFCNGVPAAFNSTAIFYPMGLVSEFCPPDVGGNGFNCIQCQSPNHWIRWNNETTYTVDNDPCCPVTLAGEVRFEYAFFITSRSPTSVVNTCCIRCTNLNLRANLRATINCPDYSLFHGRVITLRPFYASIFGAGYTMWHGEESAGTMTLRATYFDGSNSDPLGADNCVVTGTDPHCFFGILNADGSYCYRTGWERSEDDTCQPFMAVRTGMAVDCLGVPFPFTLTFTAL